MKEEDMTRGVSAAPIADKTDGPPQPPEVTVPAAALARLERMATTNMLATGLAHEIANPLSCLTAAVDALESRLAGLRAQGGAQPADIERLAADLELASISSREMFNLVRDFQHYLRPKEASRTGPGGIVGSSAAIDLKPSIVRALRMARARLEATSPVSISLADAPPVRIPSHRVTQIVLNLLLNASDAVAGRPWSANLIEIRLETVGGWAVIDVKDNGPGLDPEVRKHLFEAGASSKATDASQGLGLAICRALARESGGEISVSSPLAPGTVFRVVFPPAALTP
jgi:signal transduction histidine kinase